MDTALRGRVMVNGDCGSFFYNPELWQPEGGRYSRKAIHRLIHSLGVAGVDTFLINPNGQLPCYPSKRMRYQYQDYRRDDRDYARVHWRDCEGWSGEALEELLTRQAATNNLYLDLIEEGTDWLAETAVACREEGISPWISVRMNDSHGGRSPEKSYMNNDLLRNRPDLRLDKPCINPDQKFHRYSLDYSKPECRAYMLEMIEDMLTYDFEGMELDFGRDPVIAAPVASDTVRDQICTWMRDIRARTNAKAAETGKPFYLGLKASCNIGLLYDFGLDVDRCVEEGIFDFVSFSNYYQTCWEAPIDEQKRRYGDKVAVFGYIEGTVNWYSVQAGENSGRGKDQRTKRGREMTYSGEMILGNAAGKHVLGADSIVFFNNFFSFDKNSHTPAAHWAIQEVGSLEKLRGQPKAYSLITAFVYPLGTVALERPAALPEFIWPSASRTWRLPMMAEPGGDLVLRIQAAVERKAGVTPQLAVTINHHWPQAECVCTNKLLFPAGDYDELLEGHMGFTFTLPAGLIQEGWNEITVFNLASESAEREENEKNTFRLMNLDLAIQRR